MQRKSKPTTKKEKATASNAGGQSSSDFLKADLSADQAKKVKVGRKHHETYCSDLFSTCRACIIDFHDASSKLTRNGDIALKIFQITIKNILIILFCVYTSYFCPFHLGSFFSSFSLQGEYSDKTPFRYHVLKDVFDEDFLEEVKTELDDEEWYPKNNDLYTFAQTDDLKNTRQVNI